MPGTGEVIEMSRREVLARYLVRPPKPTVSFAQAHSAILIVYRVIGKALFRAPLAELTPGMIVGESTPSYLFYGEPVGIALCPPFNQLKGN